MDLTLVDESGQEIDMGSPIDEISERSYPDHFASADGRLLGSRALPNHRIVGCVESQIEDVGNLMTLARNPASERRWELRVNEEVHAACKTAWSDWRAA